MVNEEKHITIVNHLEVFKDTVKKTPIRDLKRLIEIGLVKKIGHKKGAYFCAPKLISSKLFKQGLFSF
jgi:hypothetical protein